MTTDDVPQSLRQSTMHAFYTANAEAFNLEDPELSMKWNAIADAALPLRDAIESVIDHCRARRAQTSQ